MASGTLTKNGSSLSCIQTVLRVFYWTHQPDYHVKMESDDIDKDSFSEISDEVPDEIVENVIPAVTDTDGIKNELPQYSVEHDLKKINRSQESHMCENTNLLPKITSQRVQRCVQPSSTVPQYRQGPSLAPEVPASNKGAYHESDWL
jgi:hypothetical protein